MGKRERLLIGDVGTIDELSWELGRVERGQMGHHEGHVFGCAEGELSVRIGYCDREHHL